MPDGSIDGPAANFLKLGRELQAAKITFDAGAENARIGAIMALDAVASFIETVEPWNRVGLAIPLARLGLALNDLKHGTVAPLLKPGEVQNRAPATRGREHLQGVAAATATVLLDIGLSRDEAHAAVVTRLVQIGVTLPGRLQLKSDTIRNWRTKAGNRQRHGPIAAVYEGLLSHHADRTAAMRVSIFAGTITKDAAVTEVLASLTRALAKCGLLVSSNPSA
jgi:hypothetical protein